MKRAFLSLTVAFAVLAIAAAAFAQARPAPKTPAKPAARTPARPAPAATKPGVPSPGAGPIVVIETVKGTIELETYPNEAPKTVEHVLALVKRNFYNGQRVLRVVPGVVQMGDPQTRDMTKRDWWGRGLGAGSGKPIGVGEFSPKRKHRLGSVGMAHAGNAAEGDSQFYISTAARPELDGKYTVMGQVISGMDVAKKLQVGDMIRRVYVKDVK